MLLWVVWAGALAGIVFRVLWVGAPRWLYTPCYLALGWAPVRYLPDFLHTGGAAVLTLIVVGGLLYSAGAVVVVAKGLFYLLVTGPQVGCSKGCDAPKAGKEERRGRSGRRLGPDRPAPGPPPQAPSPVTRSAGQPGKRPRAARPGTGRRAVSEKSSSIAQECSAPSATSRRRR